MNTPSSKSETPDPKLENPSREFISHSAVETFTVAERIGSELKGGEVFLLKGDLGVGKTVFAKGLASGLGIDPADVTSPSFTLINIHEGPVRFYHVDLYRLDPGALPGLGLEEILEDDKAVIAIEWAERLAFAPPQSTSITIDYVSDNDRRIEIRKPQSGKD